MDAIGGPNKSAEKFCSKNPEFFVSWIFIQICGLIIFFSDLVKWEREKSTYKQLAA